MISNHHGIYERIEYKERARLRQPAWCQARVGFTTVGMPAKRPAENRHACREITGHLSIIFLF